MLDGCFHVMGFIVLAGVATLIAIGAAVRHTFAGGSVLAVSVQLVRAPAPLLRMTLSATKTRSVEVERISMPRTVAETLGLAPPAGFGVLPVGERPDEIVLGGRYSIAKGEVAIIDLPAERVRPVEGEVAVEYAYRVGFSGVTAKATAALSRSSAS